MTGELKTSKYIVTDVKPDRMFPGEQRDAGWKPESGNSMPTHMAWLDGDVIPGAFYSEAVWVWPECATEKPQAEEHTHDFDEVVTFFGTDFENPRDLCGEIEFWLDGEKHIITQSFMMYIPAGMKHCPLIIRRVDRPMFHYVAGMGGDYIRK